MIRPKELAKPGPITLPDGSLTTTDAVWEMLSASRSGDLDTMRSLVSAVPGLTRCVYNYTPPIHFTVREGHVEATRFLLDQGVDPAIYRTYPFRDTLLTMARDREYEAVGQLLLEHLRRRFPVTEGIEPLLAAA